MLTPPLISNTKDSLYEFSDAGMHKDCLAKSESETMLCKHIEIYDQRIPPAKLRCVVDGKEIAREKLISLGLLSRKRKSCTNSIALT